MSEHESTPPALADLARAEFEQALRELEATVYVYGQRTDGEAVRRLDAARARVFALWQAPPRPDAAAFAKAVERFESAALEYGYWSGPNVQGGEELTASKAALLAFAPSSDAATITDEMVERLAMHLRLTTNEMTNPWSSVSESDRTWYRKSARTLLEAARNGGAHE